MKPKRLPSGSYRIVVSLGKDESGKRIYQSITNPDKYQCIREANEIAQHYKEVSRQPAKMTLKEGIDKYIQIKANVLSPSTVRGYEQIKKYHLQKEMDLQLCKITDTVAQEAINRESRDYSAKTVKNVYGVLSAVMTQFTGRTLKVTLPKTSSKAPEVLTSDQIGLLIKELQGHDAEILYLMAMFLGLRRSEIMAFDPERDYDRKTNIIHISHAKVMNKDNKFVEKDTTKTEKSDRYLKVPKYLAERIEAKMDAGEPLFKVNPSNMARSLQRICKKAVIPELGPHDLRHQNASVMLALGTPDKYAMERGGWSTDYVMKRTYQHTISDTRAQIDQNINSYFQKLAEKSTDMTRNMTRSEDDH